MRNFYLQHRNLWPKLFIVLVALYVLSIVSGLLTSTPLVLLLGGIGFAVGIVGLFAELRVR